MPSESKAPELPIDVEIRKLKMKAGFYDVWNRSRVSDLRSQIDPANKRSEYLAVVEAALNFPGCVTLPTMRIEDDCLVVAFPKTATASDVYIANAAMEGVCKKEWRMTHNGREVVIPNHELKEAQTNLGNLMRAGLWTERSR